MNAIPFKSVTARVLNVVFDLAAEVERACVFYKTESSSGTGLVQFTALSAAVTGIVLNYRGGDIDGTIVRVGDEKILIRATELASVLPPGADDYLIEALTGIRWEVIAARLDPTGTFWKLQARRAPDEDWGDLQTPTLAEDWGTLATATHFDDWQP
jgi:hypothetical protein